MSDFNEDIKINKYKLDTELVNQPQRYYEWAKAEADAADEVARLKDKLEVVKSKVEIRIRKNPTLFDLPENPKEALVKAAITIHPKVQKASKKLFNATKTHRLLTKAEKSFEHRKKSLEGLVSLNMQIHFANPRGTERKHYEIDNDRKDLLKQARNKRRIKRR